MNIRANVDAVRQRIVKAEKKAGRQAGSVELMLAAKHQPPEVLNEALVAGATTLGHNIVQQLVDTEQGLCRAGQTLHRAAMIGHVQSNKLSMAMDHAWRIDSVDSLKTAERIARRQDLKIASGDALGPFPILLQVNSAHADTQFGISPDKLLDLAARITRLDSVRIEGLMTIGARSNDPGQIRQSFALTRQLSENMRRIDGLDDAVELSMGMTGDLEIAIDEGATMVRVGSAIFGARSSSQTQA